MGVIKRQTIKGSIYSYLGVAVGFFTTALIMPRLMSQEQIGLTAILVAVSGLYSQFSTLGFTKVIERLFPYFRTKDQSHHGFVFITMVVGIVGFMISLASFFILKPYIIESNIHKSPLLVEYIFFLIPLIFFRMFFLILDTYNKMLFDSTTGTFLSDFLYRVGNLLLLIGYFFNWINFGQYIFGYVFFLCFPAMYLAGLLIYRKQFNLRPNLKFITPHMKKEMVSLSAFGIIGGLGNVALLNIDTIMLNEYYNLSLTGVYSISFFFGTIILIPGIALARSSSTHVADAWKEKDMVTLSDIYYKSTINQTFAALLLFVLIVSNLHNIFKILPSGYETGEWVIILIAFSKLIVSSSGISFQIIGTSHKYKVQTYSLGILVVLSVVFYMIFIPPYGMIGAAIGSLLSVSLASIFRVCYLYFNMKLFPYRLIHLKSAAIGLFVFVIAKMIPVFDHFLVDLIIRSSVISLVFISLSFWFHISEDVNLVVNKTLLLLKLKKW